MDPVVILGSDTVSAGPGQESRLPVRIRNQGRRVESYLVDVIGAASAFAHVVPNTVSVLPGREAEIDVIFRPPGGASTPTGSIPFAVRATSEVDASSSAVAEGRLDLAGAAGLQAWTPETSRKGRWKARYHVEFVNQGNAAVRLALTAHDPAAAVRLKLVPDVIDLAPGGRASATLDAKARQPFLRGSPANRNLQVACQTFPFGSERPVPGSPPPQGDPNHRTFQLTFEQRPVLSKFVIPLLLVAIVAFVAFAVIRLRGGEEPPLGFTNPLPPTGLKATPAGPAAILLQWTAVPNAESYEVRQVSVAGEAAPKPFEALPPDQLLYQVNELEPSTEYCFAILSHGADERESLPSGEACGSTDPSTQLSPPTDVSVSKTGDETYAVAWTHPEDGGNNVLFEIIVGGALSGTSGPKSPLTITIPAGVEAKDVSIAVMAVRGDERSAPSDPETVTVNAKPIVVESTVTPTTVPGVPTTTVDGGSSTAPPDPTSTSVSEPPVVSELENVESTFVAMLGQVSPTSEGGPVLEQRKRRLAEMFGVGLAEIRLFTNRDTIAREIDGDLSILAMGAPTVRFAYVVRADAATAEAVCAGNPTCSVLELIGAARSLEGSQVLILDSLSPSAGTSEVDAKVAEWRTRLNRQDVHVVSGQEYPVLGGRGPVVFVGGFSSADDVNNYCVRESISACHPQPLQPAT